MRLFLMVAVIWCAASIVVGTLWALLRGWEKRHGRG